MRSPLYCYNPNCDEQVGWHYTFPWTDWGQDPPEDVLYNEELQDEDGYYCSQECMDTWGARMSNEEEYDGGY